MIKVISDDKNNHWLKIGDKKPFMFIHSNGDIVLSGDVIAFGKIPEPPATEQNQTQDIPANHPENPCT
jgi:hypothetical protein